MPRDCGVSVDSKVVDRRMELSFTPDIELLCTGIY